VEAGAIRLGGRLGERAQEILAGRQQPAEPRDAATVMLLRSAGAPGGLEVYMLRRKSSMAFAPGAFVFPGGSVDPRDADEHVA
jgi:8-oxo-dGTP pyrophosphatase MutT (NUDIX family)